MRRHKKLLAIPEKLCHFFHVWTNSLWMRPVVLKVWSPKQEQSESSGNILATQILGLHSHPTKLETQKVDPSNLFWQIHCMILKQPKIREPLG